MSEQVENTTIEVGLELKRIEPKYIYTVIPAEYVCVYHRILAMLADYGVEMLKDCKATCKDRNSGVIECFNMFNAAVAAYTLGKGDETNHYSKLAATLIKYIKTKINQIYKGRDNSTAFVFPIDDTGDLKAFVSCENEPKFWINPDDMKLYSHKFDDTYDEHFRLGPEDFGEIEPSNGEDKADLTVNITPYWEENDGKIMACADIYVKDNEEPVRIEAQDVEYYFDGTLVSNFNDVQNIARGTHTFSVLIKKNGRIGYNSVIKTL